MGVGVWGWGWGGGGLMKLNLKTSVNFPSFKVPTTDGIPKGRQEEGGCLISLSLVL